MSSADAIIAKFDLQPHPEGGWFRETFRDPSTDASGRPRSTAILFLLAAGERSHWHRVDAAEAWHFYSGGPLALRVAPVDGGAIEETRLGPDILAGDAPQAVVPAHAWQSAEPLGPWTLVGCTVAPGFSFDGFELAPAGWSPAAQPENPA